MFGWWKRRKERKELQRDIEYINQNIAPFYTTFYIKKKSGGSRTIKAPADELKALQTKLVKRYFFGLPVSRAAHGFVRKRSIFTCAMHHCRKRVVIAMDIREFFPSITREMLERFVERHVADLARYPELKSQVLDMLTHDGSLPQGSPASPTIANAIFYEIDQQLVALAKRYHVTYTRYADDLFFSTRGTVDIAGISVAVEAVLRHHGFLVNRKKMRVMRQSNRQVVTGLVVNGSKPHVGRTRLRNLRAAIHLLEREFRASGPGSPSLEQLLRQVQGRVAFYSMINPDKIAPCRARLDCLTQLH